MPNLSRVEIIRERINAFKGKGRHGKAVKLELMEFYCEKKSDHVNAMPVFKLNAYAPFFVGSEKARVIYQSYFSFVECAPLRFVLIQNDA